MKKIFLTSLCALFLSWSGTVVAQTQYCGETITHLGLTEQYYQDNGISLTVEKTGDLTARVTVEPAGDRVLDFLQVQVSGLPTQDVTTLTGNAMVADLTFTSAPESITFPALLWSFVDDGGNFMAQNLVAAFGTCGSMEDDTEAPAALELVSATPAATSVTFVVKASDNSGRVSYTATVGDATATVSGASDAETTLTVKGLSPQTAYDYTITAADAAGNACTTSLTGNVTTLESKVTVWHGVVSPADYVQGGETYAPLITYSITHNDDKTLTMDMQFSSGTVGLVVEVNYGTPDNKYWSATDLGDLHFAVTTTTAFEAGEVLNGFFFIKYAGGGPSRADFSYTVGAENEPVIPVEDTEAPAIVKAEYKDCTYHAATFTFNITDNASPVVSLEISADDFATVMQKIDNVACAADVDVEITDLEAETAYALKARATDLSGNVCEPFALPEFTTPARPSLKETEYNGYINDLEAWSEKNKPDGWDEVFAPTIYYTITTTIDNQLKIHLQLTQVCTGLVPEAYVNGMRVQLTPVAVARAASNEFEGTTTASYERGTTVPVYFRFPYASNVSTTKPFDFVAGSEANLPSGMRNVASADARVFAANGAICIEGVALGSSVAVYDLAGKCLYSSRANESSMAVVPAVHGIYIVKIDDVKYKVAL